MLPLLNFMITVLASIWLSADEGEQAEYTCSTNYYHYSLESQLCPEFDTVASGADFCLHRDMELQLETYPASKFPCSPPPDVSKIVIVFRYLAVVAKIHDYFGNVSVGESKRT